MECHTSATAYNSPSASTLPFSINNGATNVELSADLSIHSAASHASSASTPNVNLFGGSDLNAFQLENFTFNTPLEQQHGQFLWSHEETHGPPSASIFLSSLSASPSSSPTTSAFLSPSGAASSDYPANHQPHRKRERQQNTTKTPRERLDAQIRCAQRRRMVMKTMCESLRSTLKSTDKIQKRAKKWVENNNDENGAESHLLKRSKKKSIDAFSITELMLAAAETIRSLGEVKDKLEAQVTADDESMLSMNDIEKQSTEISRLFQAIQFVHQQYLCDASAVRDFEAEFTPRHICANDDYFNKYSIVGIEGTYIHNQLSKARFANLPSAALDAIDSWFANQRPGCKEVLCSQMQALAAIRTGGKFKHRPFSNSTSSSFTMNVGPDVVQQMLKDQQQFVSLSSPSSSSSSSSSLLPLSSPLLLSPSSSSASSFFFSSTVDRDSLVLQHPLGPFSLSTDSFTLYLQVLEEWVSMGKERYTYEMAHLLPVALQYVPAAVADTARMIMDPFFRNGWSLKDVSQRFSFSYEQLCEHYLLYSGRKPIIDVNIAFQLPGMSRTWTIKMMTFLIRHPRTSLPLAAVTLCREIV